ncbi:right-handed parallel beta-helix repeat-containing protein [Haliangium ochraceum]|uniref:4Fe-4S ferredoxin-type domain-containing protein n=1 Tax=Haliangium ochraceum (strain DSM 14365 / JCM 11303 / SMP-2) TaxID=502025 RepID=D0LZ47_HALO1|nr:right-handed parallel beta-helix repeat-containing protein [Haliangium ochraceum]ACY16309.1 hypothetical protein Hoch_3809 [Haliangium ochraceum DSM 14365]
MCAALLAGCSLLVGIEDLPEPPPVADAAPCSGADCPAACETSTTCPTEAPVCDPTERVCTSCNALADADAACAARDSALPHCTPDGSCAVCAENAHCADASAPVCDAGSFTCGACQEHDDCAAFAGVCDRDSGACFDASAILYVKQDVAESGAECTEAAPCQTIAEALALIEADNETRKIITFLDEVETTYQEQIIPPQPPAGETLDFSILGNQTRIQAPSGAKGSLVDLSQRTHVHLEKLVIEGSDESGVFCVSADNSSVSIREAQVRNHAGVGVNVTACALTLIRSIVTGNEGGGLTVTNSSFQIANNFIYSNGSSSSASGGVSLSGNNPQSLQEFAFNTVFNNNTASPSVAVGVHCIVSQQAQFTSNIIHKGNRGSAAIGGENCIWRHSAIQGIEADALDPALVPVPTNIDSDCGISPAANPPRLSAGSPCIGAGEADTGIATDFDGDPRDPVAPDIGADEFVPAAE